MHAVHGLLEQRCWTRWGSTQGRYGGRRLPQWRLGWDIGLLLLLVGRMYGGSACGYDTHEKPCRFYADLDSTPGDGMLRGGAQPLAELEGGCQRMGWQVVG